VFSYPTEAERQQETGIRWTKRLLIKFKIVLVAGMAIIGGGVWLVSLHEKGTTWNVWEVSGELGKFVALVLSIHLIDYHFIRREERLVFNEELRHALNSELRDVESLVHETKRALEKDRVTTYQEREDMYKAICESITYTDQHQPGLKSLLLVGLHGDRERRLPELLHNNPVLKRFDNLLFNTCINSSGPNMWYVREIYLISNEERLAMILERIRNAKDAEGYEVRGLCMIDPIPQLKPLIVGNGDLFLGVDDPTYYRVRAGFHLQGNCPVELASEMFDLIWNDPRLFKLRTATGENENGIESIREAVQHLRIT
jgi:hypothetical protein